MRLALASPSEAAVVVGLPFWGVDRRSLNTVSSWRSSSVSNVQYTRDLRSVDLSSD